MKIGVQWRKPIALKDAEDKGLIFSADLKNAPTTAGVYIFGRQHGSTLEALYIGSSMNLKKRVSGHFKTSVGVMNHIKRASSGRRVVLCGEFKPKSGQNTKKCISIIEKTLIRHFLSEGHNLVNKKGTKIQKHEINSLGTHGIPRTMFVNG